MKKIAIIGLLLLTLFWFWKISELNYIKHREIKRDLVEHPDSMISKYFAKGTSIWYKNLRADLFWLETIQYIGGNAISSEYKKYLFKVLDLITELNPYFEKPYKIWLLLLPSYSQRYEELSDIEQNENIRQAETIWLKWVANFCDEEKIELIKNEEDLKKIWSEDKYKEPCKSYDIPYYLAFVYYFYMHEPEKASLYYKIASANTGSPEWAKILTAIMQGKWWDREKAFFMFLNISKTLDNEEEQICSNYSSELEKIWAGIFTNQIKFDWRVVKAISDSKDEIVWKWSEDTHDWVLADTQCSNYVNKAVREINLNYIEIANERYKTDNNGESASNAKVLFDKWYIDYLPKDYQQYDEYEIIYEYNPDTWNFDYDMGVYE